ncbi:MAG: hypothetical protein LAO79_05855 [Acidobacteriia bacterium]|nr:hypothetical protein [Terriglobia bacterium]
MDPRLFLNVASAAAGVFALCRLITTGVFRAYCWFAVYLVAASLQCFIWLAGGPEDHLYAIIWAASTAGLLGLRIVVVVELWHKLNDNARAGLLSRSFTWTVLILAATVAAASGLDSLRLFGQSPQRLAFYILSLASRYSSSALCVICSALAIFAVMFPRGVSKNAIRHAFLLTAYFASIAAGFLVMNFVRGSAPLVGALLSGSSAGLYVLWGVLLTEPGELAPIQTPVFSQPELS